MHRFYQRLLCLGLLFCLGFGLCWLPAVSSRAVAQSVAAAQLVQQGVQKYQAGRFPEAIDLWQQALPTTKGAKERAIVLTNLGQAYRKIGNPSQAITQWEQAIQIYQSKREAKDKKALAQLLTEQAQAYSDLGQHQPAIDRLSNAIQLARSNQDVTTEAAAQGALGNAFWALGDYDQALNAHERSLGLSCQIKSNIFITTSLNNLGNVFSSRADRFRFQATAASLEGDTSKEKELKQKGERDSRLALAAYQRSAEVSRAVGSLAEARALLNFNYLLEKVPSSLATTPPQLQCETLDLSALVNSQKLLTVTEVPANDNQKVVLLAQNRDRILALLTAEPDSQDKAYGLINLANSLMLRNKKGQMEGIVKTSAAKLNPIALLEQALTVTETVADGRAESFARGTLGGVYEARKQYDQAMKYTRDAQLKAQEVGAGDSLYRWQWQMGRILNATGQRERSITSYEQAIGTLQSIRGDIVVANKDLQFDFRDSVEPVYRELIGLLLTDTPSTLQAKTKNLSATPSNKTNVSRVLEILEQLKLAELQNFFGDDCVQVARDNASSEQSLLPGGNNEATYGLQDQNAAVVYSIVLEEQTFMILRFPDGKLKKYPVLFAASELGIGNKQLGQVDQKLSIGADNLQKKIDQLRELLEKRSTEEYLIQAKVAYDAMIAPMEKDLQTINPKTLVFINDGVLRKVPMAALHDGKQFLIEKYPIANTPSLSLTTRRPFGRDNVKALIMGLTVERSPFAPLPNVSQEVTGVQQILGGTKLLNQAFTLGSMRERLEKNSYPIIHMATHGKFGADAASTFLLAYDANITINQLDEVLRTRRSQQPVELLTLSACQTAAGDNRSALGIAGVAVRAGVKSALATLWFINDQATVPLIKEFYNELLQPGVSKAEALQKAQIKLISDREYNHPAVWSPFILIGNWL